MECTRCHGLMVERPCWERESWHVPHRWARPFTMWSCLNCGNCLDKTIAFHKHAQREDMVSKRHQRIWEEIVRQLEASAA